MKHYRITLAVLGLAALNGAATLRVPPVNTDPEPHAAATDTGPRPLRAGISP